MANIFHSDEKGKIDVGSIPNFDYLLNNFTSRRNYPIIFHIVYVLLCAMCVFVAVNGTCAGLSPLVSTICMCLGPALMTYTFLYSPGWVKAVSLALPVLSCFAVHMLTGGKNDFLHESGHILMYLLVICVAAFLTKTSLSGYKKSSCFVIITSVYMVMTLVSFAVLLVYYKGTLSTAVALESLNEVSITFIDSVIKELSSEQNLSELKNMLPNAKSMSDSEILSMARNSLEQSITITKLILPAIVTITCMFLSFITVEMFSVVAKKMKIDVFVCVMDKFWTYRPTNVTATVYDIVFFAYVISMFVSFPANIGITIENLILILAPVMAVTGIKSIYRFFFKRNKKRGTSIIICIAIVFAMLWFMGTLGILLIGSLGVMFVTLRDKEEWELFTHSPLAVQNLEKKNLFLEAVSNKNSTGDNNKSK